MKSPSLAFLLLPASIALVIAWPINPLTAETVAEWKFDGTSDESGGSVVKLAQAREGASDESVLCQNSSTVASPTGLSKKWISSLTSGYLETGSGAGLEASLNKDGLVTKHDPPDRKKGFYPAYFGFSDLGNGSWEDGSLKGGTVYLVLSFREAPKQGMKYGLMGSGHAGDGGVQLGITKMGELRFLVGGKTVGEASAVVTRDWAPDVWYFIAAAWRGNSDPILYVREMASEGPSKSPDASVGEASGTAPATGSFDGSPLAIGATWYDPGANAGTIYGSGSKIAYARFDNVYATKEEIEAVFKALGAP